MIGQKIQGGVHHIGVILALLEANASSPKLIVRVARLNLKIVIIVI